MNDVKQVKCSGCGEVFDDRRGYYDHLDDANIHSHRQSRPIIEYHGTDTGEQRDFNGDVPTDDGHDPEIESERNDPDTGSQSGFHDFEEE